MPHVPTSARIWASVAALCAIVAALGVTTHFHLTDPLDRFMWSHALDTRTEALTVAAIVIARVFSTVGMVALSLVVGAVIWWRGKAPRLTAMFWLSGAITAAATYVIKHVVSRQRPPVGDRLTIETTFSFPSGHSSASAAFLLALALVIVAFYPRLKPWVWAAAIVMLLTVMASRVYLGVHWFTDVTAGACLGAAVVVAVHHLYRRVRIEVLPRNEAAPKIS